MRPSLITTSEEDVTSCLPLQVLCSGHLVGVTSSGKALVDYPNNAGGPLEARTVVAVDVLAVGDPAPVPVLLFFENANPERPIIVGVIRETVRQPMQTANLALDRRGQDIVVDGKALRVDATEEVVLRCGASSVTLRRDGKIVLKGTEIISRASEVNKVRGSVVKIN